MKKISLLCLIMLVLSGCGKASTFDFDEFVNQYPSETQLETMTLPWETTQEPTTVVEENITKESEEQQPIPDVETLYRNTVKIQLGEGKKLEDVCVTGDVVVYWVDMSGEDRIYLTSASKGGDELIFSTENEIYNIACDEGRIIWRLYNIEQSAYEVYLYEKGEITHLENLISIKDVDEIDIDGNYILFFSGILRYTYDMVRDELTEIPVEESKYLYDYVLRWDYEDGYGGFACEANHIKIKDVYGNVVYEKQLERLELMYQGNRNMIVLERDSEGNVFVDCIDGEDYSIKYQADYVMVTDNWVFMCNQLRNTLKVFNPNYPGLIWEMDATEVKGSIHKADKGQVMFYHGDDDTATVTVYTMK